MPLEATVSFTQLLGLAQLQQQQQQAAAAGSESARSMCC